MDKRNNDFAFDFKPIGQAIKAARKAQGMTREQLSRIVDYDPRHLQAIENEGQYPSIELFIQLDAMDIMKMNQTFGYQHNHSIRPSVSNLVTAYYNHSSGFFFYLNLCQTTAIIKKVLLELAF